MLFALFDNHVAIWLGLAETSWLNRVERLCLGINVAHAPHLFFLFRSPNLGKTMLDFRPRLFTILPFFDLVDFDVWSISIAAREEHEVSSMIEAGRAHAPGQTHCLLALSHQQPWSLIQLFKKRKVSLESHLLTHCWAH